MNHCGNCGRPSSLCANIPDGEILLCADCAELLSSRNQLKNSYFGYDVEIFNDMYYSAGFDPRTDFRVGMEPRLAGMLLSQSVEELFKKNYSVKCADGVIRSDYELLVYLRTYMNHLLEQTWLKYNR